jgi:hypothetical protein
VIDGLFLAKQTDALLQIARTEPDEKLRKEAVVKAGMIHAENTAAELRGLYQNEKDREVKAAILRGLYFQGDVASLIQIARAESDPQLKKEAVRWLSNSKSKEADDYLLEILAR